MKDGRTSVIGSLIRDRLSMIGLGIILLAVIVAVSGAYLRPDASKNANEQHLSLARKSPGFAAVFLRIPKLDSNMSSAPLGGLFFGGLDSRYDYFPYDSLGVSESEVVLYWEKATLLRLDKSGLKSLIQTERSNSIEDVIADNSVERQFLLGTDSFGRDMLSRLMAGTLVSLSVGFISVLISLVIGVTLGAIAGYYRGIIDNLVMWFINVIWSIPTLLMVIAITLVMGKGFVQVFIAVGLTMWVEVARIVRGQFISLRELPYIEAGRSMGYSAPRLIFKHLLPNAMGPVIVISAANFAAAILIEAGLSFLGIGTQIPMPSWGTMIKEHYAYITTDMAYLALLPGACITLLVLAFMLIGNRLRDIQDVRM